MFLKSLLVLVLTVVYLNGGVTEAKNAVSPSEYPFIYPCHKSDPQLDSCVKHALDHLKTYLINGLPDLGVPTIEPLYIDRMEMENKVWPVNLKAIFTNVTIVGPSLSTTTKTKTHLNNNRVNMALALPRLEMTGRYDVTGQVFSFPLNSEGNFWAEFKDVTTFANFFGKEIVKENTKYMVTDRLLLDYKLKDIDFKIRDTGNYGSAISDEDKEDEDEEDEDEKGGVGEAAMKQFFDDNARMIIEEMRPAACVAIAKHIKKLVNILGVQVPLDVWLKP